MMIFELCPHGNDEGCCWECDKAQITTLKSQLKEVEKVIPIYKLELMNPNEAWVTDKDDSIVGVADIRLCRRLVSDKVAVWKEGEPTSAELFSDGTM